MSIFHSFILMYHFSNIRQKSFEYVFLSATLINGNVNDGKRKKNCSQAFTDIYFSPKHRASIKNTETILRRKQVPET